MLKALGEIVHDEWMRTAIARPHVTIDTLIVMPNHLHGIIIVNGTNIRRGDPAGRPYTPNHRRGPVPGSVGAIIGQFKSLATKRINAHRHTPGNRAWQRNYYEHVIRNETDLNEIRQYILDNSVKWDMDENNPNRQINELEPRGELICQTR
jgi:REP element-mobilizing transposase RayT